MNNQQPETENKSIYPNIHETEENYPGPLQTENVIIHDKQYYMEDSDTDALFTNIEILQVKQQVNHEAIEKLWALATQLQHSYKNPSIKIVTQHFINVTEKLIANPQPTEAEVEADIVKLQKDLRGKPPLSAKIVGLIFGVVGALIGFSVGVFAGVVSTSGIGSLPAGIAAAFKGFTFGVKSGIGIGAICGFLSGANGLLHGSMKREEYKKQKENEIKAVTPFIEEVHTALAKPR